MEFQRHISERKGDISIVENMKGIPFDVKRIFYLYNIPADGERGAHAHRNIFQLIVAASGSFDVEVDDGKDKQTFILNRPYKGLLVYPGLWAELKNFSSGSVCLVLTSDVYQEKEYIRDYDEFIDYRRKLFECKE